MLLPKNITVYELRNSHCKYLLSQCNSDVLNDLLLTSLSLVCIFFVLYAAIIVLLICHIHACLLLEFKKSISIGHTVSHHTAN